MALNFGLNANVKATVINPGQKATDDRLILTVRSTEGKFSITGAVSKLLGVARGERVMFITNADLLEALIQAKDENILAFAAENGFEESDIDSVEFHDALFNAHLTHYIAKGFAMLKRDGTPMMEAVRTTNETKQAYLDEYRHDFYIANREAIKAKYAEKIDTTGMSEEEIDDVIENMISVDDVKSNETPKFAGSLTSSTSKMAGIGLALDFTDNTVWKTLKNDLTLEVAKKKNRIFDVLVDEKTEAIVNNGMEDITVTIYPLAFAEDTDVMDRKKKNEE